MKNYIIVLLSILSLSVRAQVNTLVPGNVAPDIRLTNVDGKTIGFKDYPEAKGFVVVFTCNTCPVAQAYEQRVIELNTKSTALGYPVIAVNANDPAVSQGDSFEKMQERAKAKGYAFPYLDDPGQKVTNRYGATKTPHLFLARRTDKGLIVEYTGAIDDDPQGENPERSQYVIAAIQRLNANQAPSISTTKAIGCSVKRGKTKSASR